MSATTTMTVTRTTEVTSESRTKDIALFVVAPFIGLAYALFFPLFAIGAIAWIGGKALIESTAVKAALRYAKEALMITAAPAVGLAFVAALPVAGVAALVWVGVHGSAPLALGA